VVKKLYESEYRGFDESATKVTVYEFDSEEERGEFYELEHQERCSCFNVFDESGYEVSPGASYHTYYFEISNGILVMHDVLSLNV